MPDASPDTLDFEAALRELEALVARLEEGELSLEASLHEFERGMALTRRCQQLLEQAEQRVQQLTERGELQDFGPADDQ